jgi:hypothetical protein
LKLGDLTVTTLLCDQDSRYCLLREMTTCKVAQLSQSRQIVQSNRW